jgi:hypothetical protein
MQATEKSQRPLYALHVTCMNGELLAVPGYISKTFRITCQAGIYIITAVT